jgi:hypothetical protein
MIVPNDFNESSPRSNKWKRNKIEIEIEIEIETMNFNFIDAF